jgi:hypothetical protein
MATKAQEVKAKVRVKVSPRRLTPPGEPPPGERIPSWIWSPKAVKKKKKKQCAKKYL